MLVDIFIHASAIHFNIQQWALSQLQVRYPANHLQQIDKRLTQTYRQCFTWPVHLSQIGSTHSEDPALLLFRANPQKHSFLCWWDEWEFIIAMHDAMRVPNRVLLMITENIPLMGKISTKWCAVRWCAVRWGSFFGRVSLPPPKMLLLFRSPQLTLGGDVRRVAGIGQPVIVSVVVGVWHVVGVRGEGLVRGGVCQWAVGDGRGVGGCDGCNGRSGVHQRLRRRLGSGQGQDGGEYELEVEDEALVRTQNNRLEEGVLNENTHQLEHLAWFDHEHSWIATTKLEMRSAFYRCSSQYWTSDFYLSVVILQTGIGLKGRWRITGTKNLFCWSLLFCWAIVVRRQRDQYLQYPSVHYNNNNHHQQHLQ